MPLQYVPISKLHTTRQLAPGDDLADLAAEAEGEGIIHPPLVTQSFEIIDGLRRIELARRWLFEGQLQVVVAENFEEIAKYLRDAVEARGTMRPLRVPEIYEATKPYGREWMKRQKAVNQRGRIKKQRGGVSESPVRFLTEALGVPKYAISDGQDFLRLGKLDLNESQRKMWDDLHQRIQNKTLTPSGGRNAMYRYWKASELGRPEPAQRYVRTVKESPRTTVVRSKRDLQAVRTLVGTFEGTAAALSTVSNIREILDPEEAALTLKRLVEARRQMGYVINALRNTTHGNFSQGKAAANNE